MTYHLSSEQYQRGVDYLASMRRSGAEHLSSTSSTMCVLGMAGMLAELADSNPARVMRDSDARLAILDDSDCAR